jgi:protein TonB
MVPETAAAQDLANSRRRPAPRGTHRYRLLMIAVALSVLVHLLPLGLIVFLPRAAPTEKNPDDQGAVELLMVERKGAEPSQPGQPDTPTFQATEPQISKPSTAPPEKAETPPAETPVPPPPASNPASEPVPAPPSSPSHATTQSEAEPPRPENPPSHQAPVAAPVFDFAGTDSDTNATVMSGRVLPAMPDDRFRNRPPAYPSDAAMRGETGAVLVIVHVAPNGLATGADIAESSGSASLDKAAVTAVRKWRFRPAMQGGLAVPFDMPFRFVFSSN